MKKLFITTPIYYASGKPHIGHAYTTILADVIARYKKALGYDVFFLTGMDEHGQKIVDTAKKNNLEVQVMLDSVTKDFKQLWKDLDINYNGFIRTTDKNHEVVVQKVFSELVSKQFAYLGSWKGLYCVNCEENYTRDQAIEKDGKLYCKVGHELTQKNEPSYFLKVSEFAKWIKEQLNKEGFVVPKSRVNELIGSFIDKGLEDLSITRTSLVWGIPTKEDPKHVVYVWIDALLSYLSGLGYLTKDDKNYQKYWVDKDSQVIHLMSKEITRFHCIYWPILLKMLGLRLPSKIISHGWVVTKKGKMSKSLGNVVNPNEYVERYGSDALRYFILKQLSIYNDGIFSKELFEEVFNSDLANNVGNMISRITSMVINFNDGIIPKKPKNLKMDKIDDELISLINGTINRKHIEKYVDDTDFYGLLTKIKFCYLKLNEYIETKKPWNMKKAGHLDELAMFLNIVFNSTCTLMILLSPVLVKTRKIIERTWNINLSFDKLNFDWAGIKIENIPPLFPRIDIKK